MDVIKKTTESLKMEPLKRWSAVFAGGCFRCAEADFGKVDGGVDAIAANSPIHILGIFILMALNLPACDTVGTRLLCDLFPKAKPRQEGYGEYEAHVKWVMGRKTGMEDRP